MWVRVGHIKKEWTCCRIAPNEIARVFNAELGLIAAMMVVIVFVNLNQLFLVVVLRRPITLGLSVLNEPAAKLIKAMVGGSGAWVVSIKMPFTHESGVIAGLLQIIGYCSIDRGYICAANFLISLIADKTTSKRKVTSYPGMAGMESSH